MPGIDIVKYDGRAEAPENPVDGPDAVDGEYGGPTPGDWAAGVDAECTVWEGMVHCWQLFAPALDEALVSLELAGRFIAQHQRGVPLSAAA